MFDTKPFEDKISHALEHFQDELKKIRTGRAHVSMLEGVMVESYGVMVPLNQAANVTAPEAQMLLVTPFDPGNVTAISAAIRNSPGQDFNPSDDGRMIRIPVPPLTEERRRQLVKQASEKVEDARIAVRTIRQDALKEAKKLKDNKEIGEDGYKLIEREIDGIVADTQSKIDEIFKAKEKDVMTI